MERAVLEIYKDLAEWFYNKLNHKSKVLRELSVWSGIDLIRHYVAIQLCVVTLKILGSSEVLKFLRF